MKFKSYEIYIIHLFSLCNTVPYNYPQKNNTSCKERLYVYPYPCRFGPPLPTESPLQLQLRVDAPWLLSSGDNT